MIDPTDYTKNILKRLKKKLDNLCYDHVHMASRFYDMGYVNYFLDPWPNINLFERTVKVLPTVNRLLYDLLLLGKTLQLTDVEKIFTVDEINDLSRIGLLTRNDELVNTGNLRILSFLGRYFIVSAKEQLSNIYIGSDSYLLAYNLSIPRDSDVLDLCTGSGIQAILASDKAKKVIGIEIDKDVANIANCNVALNDAENKVEIRVGDLYEPVFREQFDIICSNPPFMAVPENVEYFLSGNGGPDGLKIINRILEGLDDHLAKDGKCFMAIMDLIGDDDGPLLEKKLRQLCEKNRWSATLILPSRGPIYYQANFTADLAKLINNVTKDELLLRWKRTFEELHVNKTYLRVLCIIRKADEFNLNRIDLYKSFPDSPDVEFPDGKPFKINKIRNFFNKKSN